MDTPLAPDQRSSLLESVLKTAAPELSLWRPREAVEIELGALLDEQVGLMTDREWAKGFREMIGIGEPEEYLNRIIRISGVDVLCGIRFYGGDASKPFVDAIAWSDTIDDWSGLASEVLEHYKRFSPNAIRVYSSTGVSEELFSGFAAVPDQVLAAAPVRVMADRTAGVELRDAGAIEAHEFLVSAYAGFARRRPDLAERVHASSLDELRDCERDGRLAWWLVGGEVAGMIAACKAGLFGIRGYLMMDEAVGEAFRGQGSAAMAQAALAQWCVERDPDAVLFGTIDAINHASRRAAQRAGRKEIAGWWFIQPATSAPVSDVLVLWD